MHTALVDPLVTQQMQSTLTPVHVLAYAGARLDHFLICKSKVQMRITTSLLLANFILSKQGTPNYMYLSAPSQLPSVLVLQRATLGLPSYRLHILHLNITILTDSRQ